MEFAADETILVHQDKKEHWKKKGKHDRTVLLIEQDMVILSMEFDADEKILVHQYKEKQRKGKEPRDRTKLLIQKKRGKSQHGIRCQ